jgi:hypothetical protein
MSWIFPAPSFSDSEISLRMLKSFMTVGPGLLGTVSDRNIFRGQSIYILSTFFFFKFHSFPANINIDFTHFKSKQRKRRSWNCTTKEKILVTHGWLTLIRSIITRGSTKNQSLVADQICVNFRPFHVQWNYRILRRSLVWEIRLHFKWEFYRKQHMVVFIHLFFRDSVWFWRVMAFIVGKHLQNLLHNLNVSEKLN